MKKLFLLMLICTLILSAGCRPETTGDNITENPDAATQPVGVQPDKTENGEQDTDPKNQESPTPATETSLSDKTKELSADYAAQEIGYTISEEFPAAAADFGLRLLKNTAKKEKNALVSPISAMFALGMTANGAKGNTYVEMEQTLLGKNSNVLLNASLAAYRQKVTTHDQLHLANSIWIRNQELDIKQDFLQSNANYYDSRIFSSSFDENTVRDVNLWVKENTNEMIPALLTQAPTDETVMYLINALAFDGRWASPFAESNTAEGTFTAANGDKQTVQMMKHIDENYLEKEFATGFHKSYEGGDSFVALLPKAGTTPEQLLASLDGKGWQQLLIPKENSVVHLTLPKFETEFSASLKKPLQAMGIRDAFNFETADFSAIGTANGEPLYISDVLQKTVFELDEEGTRAAAATVVEAGTAESAPDETPKEYTVTLDRPFVYAIVDNNNVPLFLGIMNSVK